MSEYTHKVSINLSLIDGQQLWTMIHGQDTKYSASRVDTATKMKYFNFGIQLIRAKEFREEYSRDSDYLPMTNWVLLISLSGDLKPNGKSIVRRRNRTSLAVSCEIESIREGGQMWADPGLALDPRHIQYITTHVDYKSGKVTIRGRLPQGLDLKETPYDYISLLEKMSTRHVNEINQFQNMTDVDHYVSKDGQDMMFDYLSKFLTYVGIHNATATPVRERIAALLTVGQDPNAYVRNGVAFINEKEFHDLMSTRNNNEALVLRYKHDQPIVERLMTEHRHDATARLKQMDLHQLQQPVNVDEMLMDYQIALDEEEWSAHDKEYREAMLTNSQQFVEEKWRTLVIQRWKALQV